MRRWTVRKLIFGNKHKHLDSGMYKKMWENKRK